MRLAQAITLLALFGLPLAADASLVVYEGFDYASGSPLAGQNGGLGWSGAWDGSGLSATMDAGLSYSNLATSGGSVASAPPVSGTVAFYTRPLSETYGADNTSLYLSFLLRPDEGFGFYGGLNLEGLFIGKSGPVDLYSLEGPTDAISSSAVAPVAGTTVLLVLHAEFLPGNDRFSLYVNPTPGGLQPAVANAVKTDYDMPLADFIYLNNAGAWTTDEIRIGSTFASVTPAAVPEPGFLAMWAMVPVFVLAGRRFRWMA